MIKVGAFLIALSMAAPAAGQSPVNRGADWASWGTAAVNPTMAAIDAVRSPSPKCRLARLALSEAVGNGLTIGLKHLIVSPRPCLGCAPDGMPSGHTMNSTIGFSSRWRVGLAFTLSTAELRTVANRHTPWQVAAGAGIGFLAEAVGHTIHCP